MTQRVKIKKDWWIDLPEDMQPRDEWRKGELPMTQAEVAAWVEQIGPTDEKQLSAIRNLLHFAVGDCMSVEDVTICKQEYQKLKDKLFPDKAAEKRGRPIGAVKPYGET